MLTLEQVRAALRHRYAVDRELGAGGMAHVYLAQDLRHHRNVAVKVLRPELAAVLGADRFLREIEIAARLQHPHILALLDSGEADGLLYYVMPFVQGESLRDRLTRDRELPVAEAARILRDVLDALAHAHEQGVIHRDVKPENVMLSGRHAVVTDFGVAKAVSEATGRHQLTSAGVALGTPAYMAPEQATADPLTDHRADLYAVGVMGYEMLAGRLPFTGPSPQALLAAHVTQKPEPLTVHRAAVSGPFGELVMKCLEKRPADRWQTAVQMLEQLEAVATLSGGTAPAIPEATPRRRFRPLLLAGLMLAAALVVVVVLRSRGPTTNAPLPLPRLVVLPFENLGAPDDEYFAEGMTEAITTRLARLSGLAVIARQSAVQYRASTKSPQEIGEELNIQYLLEGTVSWEKQPGASRVRINPQLIRASDAVHVWAEPYEAVLAGVFQVQAEIAEQVARALAVTLLTPEREALAERPTKSDEAYDYYLRGEAIRDHAPGGDGVRQAAALFEKAIAVDSSFALAYAALAELLAILESGPTGSPGRHRAMAERAVALEPDLPESRLALATSFSAVGDDDRAVEEILRAARRHPNHAPTLVALANIQLGRGQYEEAVSAMRRLLDIDPRNYHAAENLAFSLVSLGRYAEAEGAYNRVRALRPDLQGGEWYTAVAWSRGAAGDEAGAREIIRDGLRQVPDFLQGVTRTGLPILVYLARRWLDSAGERVFDQAKLSAAALDTGVFHLAKGELYRRSDPPRARTSYEAAAGAFEARIRRGGNTWFLEANSRAALGFVLARLGRGAEALDQARRVAAINPLARSAWAGSDLVFFAIATYALAGRPDQALDLMESSYQVPGMKEQFNWLFRSDSLFAPLWKDPGFEKLTASKPSRP